MKPRHRKRQRLPTVRELQLAEAEARLKQARQARDWRQLGQVLDEVRRQGLHLARFRRFVDFCREVVGFSGNRAYYLIHASRMAQDRPFTSAHQAYKAARAHLLPAQRQRRITATVDRLFTLIADLADVRHEAGQKLSEFLGIIQSAERARPASPPSASPLKRRSGTRSCGARLSKASAAE
jgi:hypothetical protein